MREALDAIPTTIKKKNNVLKIHTHEIFETKLLPVSKRKMAGV
jgi:hypothetical protein